MCDKISTGFASRFVYSKNSMHLILSAIAYYDLEFSKELADLKFSNLCLFCRMSKRALAETFLRTII